MKTRQSKKHLLNKDETLRTRVSMDLKKRVLAVAKTRLTTEGQIVREAVKTFLDETERKAA